MNIFDKTEILVDLKVTDSNAYDIYSSRFLSLTCLLFDIAEVLRPLVLVYKRLDEELWDS